MKLPRAVIFIVGNMSYPTSPERDFAAGEYGRIGRVSEYPVHQGTLLLFATFSDPVRTSALRKLFGPPSDRG